MTKETSYNIPEVNNRNVLTNSSTERNTITDMEVWQVIFSEEYQNEYSMQWLDKKFAPQMEILRRRERDEWESENVKPNIRIPK